MAGSSVYRGELFNGFGYDYDGLSSTFQQIHHELIKQHQEAFLVMNNADREYLAAKSKLLNDVGDSIAGQYHQKAKELGELHSILYALLSVESMTAAQKFRAINIPSGIRFGNLQDITPKPHGQSAIYYEHLAGNNGSEMAKQVRQFTREY